MSKLIWAWTLMIAGAALALGATLPAAAADEKPYRVRGTLEAVEGDQLTVDTREGETLDLTLNDDTRVMVVRPASLEDIKQGDYVGLTSIDFGRQACRHQRAHLRRRPARHRRGPRALGPGQGAQYHDQCDGRGGPGSG